MSLKTVLIKPASGMCNMDCRYCFYCDESSKRSCASFGMMSETTVRNIIKKTLREARGEICFAFQGGEPSLRGISFYEKVMELEARLNRNQVKITNVFQTNGLLIDEEWCRFFRDNDFLIGISVDGTESLHDRFRRDREGNPTYERVVRAIGMLDRWEVRYNILTVVTGQLAENIADVYRSYKKNGWMYQQYIACLDPIGEERGKEIYSLTPEKYGNFLIRLFELWEKDWRRGKAPYIRQFENYIGILLGYPPESCEQSGICSVQCVAEADGSAYPCDFYVLDEYRLGNYNEDTPETMMKDQRAAGFVRQSSGVPGQCRECRWYALCRNGCRRNRIPCGGEEAQVSYYCKSYKMFFDRCARQMEEIARFLR